MKKRLSNLEATIASLKPYLEQYLQQHGINTEQNFSCLNPKHEDDSPSMTCRQHPEQAFCFGCSCAMDIFTAANFLENKPLKGKGFIEENVMYLADKFGVTVDMEDLTPEEIYEYRTYEAYSYAATLVSDPSFGDYTLADEEIKRRGWDKDKLKEWGVGTINFDEFKDRMRKAGYEPNFLAGIDLDRSNLFDNYNLLFTVHDDSGRPVGFSAKNLQFKKDGSKGPKYTNSRETRLECSIFKKGHRLYGFDMAKETNSPLYIFEGQADVVTARHYGVMNCCCTLGTALTDHHVNLLKRYGKFSIVLAFDGDQAGQLALLKAVDEKFTKEKDFRIKICQMPPNKDPDEFFRENGIDDFVRLKKWTAFEWRMMSFADGEETEELNDEKREEIATKMAGIIAGEKSHVKQSTMAKQVAKLTGFDVKTILSEAKYLRDVKEAALQDKKRNAVESLMYDIRQNPEEIEHALVQAQAAVEEINRSVHMDNGTNSTLEMVMNQKEYDEAKTGEFAGYHMKPDGLYNIAKRLNEDWKSGIFMLIGGSEQAGKCQHFQTLVPVPLGNSLTIEEIVKRKEPYVLGMSSTNKIVPMKVKNWIDSGKLECFEVKTKQGISTKPSETHPYYTLDGWKQVKELSIGDRIAIVRNYDCFNDLTSPVSENDAIILGGLLSEGSITRSFGFSNTDEELIDYFKEALESKWGKLGYRVASNTLHVTDPLSRGSRMIDWLKSYGIHGKTAHTKTIPKEIFQCSPKRIAKFLGMFWAGDGWVYFNPEKSNKCEVGLTLCNYEMIKQIRSLLLRFGIKTRITEGKKKNQSGKEFDAYTISIKDIENIKKFYNNIRIPLQYKQDNLKAILMSDKTSIGSYADNFPAELWDRIKLKTEEHGWTFNYLMTLIGEDKNRFNYDKGKDRFKEIAAWRPTANSRKHKGQEWLQITPRKLRLIGNLLQDRFLIDLADGDIYFDEITSIDSIGKQQCYDLEIPGDHNFIAEDTVVHNTSLCCQLAYEIASDERNNAICIYHSIDDAAKFILYKLVCNAADDTKLHLNHVSSPAFWSKQPGYEYTTALRKEGYDKITKMIQDGSLIIKDSKDGQTLAYIESVVKTVRAQNPGKNIMLFSDNFHKYPDHGNLPEAVRNKKLSGILKTMCTVNNMSIVATVEYKKGDHDSKPNNSSMAETRALQYDASVVMHLFNEVHHKGEDASILIHENEFGIILPRIFLKFGKNKVAGYEGAEFFDFHPHNARFKSVDLDQAREDQKKRLAWLKNEGTDYEY